MVELQLVPQLNIGHVVAHMLGEVFVVFVLVNVAFANQVASSAIDFFEAELVDREVVLRGGEQVLDAQRSGGDARDNVGVLGGADLVGVETNRVRSDRQQRNAPAEFHSPVAPFTDDNVLVFGFATQLGHIAADATSSRTTVAQRHTDRALRCARHDEHRQVELLAIGCRQPHHFALLNLHRGSRDRTHYRGVIPRQLGNELGRLLQPTIVGETAVVHLRTTAEYNLEAFTSG